MKLAVVGPAFPFRGGIAHYTTLLVRALRERHQVELYAFRRLYARALFPGSTAPDPSAMPLVEACSPTLDGLDPRSWFHTARRVVDGRPELLVLQWWTPYWLPLHLLLAGRARASGIPVLTVVHQLVEPDSCRAERPLARLALRSSDALLVAGEGELRRVQRWFPGRPARTGRLPAFAHCPGAAPSREEARQELGVRAEAIARLFENGLASSMGEAAARAGARRSWESLVAVLEELAAGLIRPGSAGAQGALR